MENELLYVMTIKVLKEMLSKGLITQEEYCRFDTMLIEKYSPSFCKLFVDLP